MLTITQLLHMPVFETAQVVAGRGGLSNRVQWVHMIDIPEMADWSREGELLFTTAFGLKERPDVQSALIPNLVAQGVAGMVVAIGRYFYDIPSVMMQQADELDLPIITLPWEVPFIEVTRAISERIVHDRYALMQKSLQIHNTLTQIALMGDDLVALAQALAELVRCPVTIEDPDFNLLAAGACGQIDPAREQSLQQGRTPPPVLAELDRRGLLTHLRQSLHPVHIPPLPEQGLTFERIVAPIVAGQERFGYVWIIAQDRQTDELDMIAIEHAATVAALILLKEKAIYETEQRLKSALLDELLTGDGGLHGAPAARARRLGFDLSQGQQILLLRPQNHASLPALQRWVENRLQEWRIPGLTVERGPHLALLLPGERTQFGEKVAHRLQEYAQTEHYELLIGVGRAYPGRDRLAESYQEALEALHLGPALLDRTVVSFDELGVFHWLQHLPPAVRAKNPFSQTVESLADYDARHRTHLLSTLETYLDTGRNSQATAQQLYLHRNTLRQRLAKIESLGQFKLDDPFVALNLHVTLKERRLRSNG